MDILPAGTSQSASAEVARSTAGISSDFDTFLTLLTAQIRNQDPLEPADSTEYTAQLATFSNVEQSVRTNELLADMVDMFTRQEMSSAAGWIGKDVQHSGPIGHSGAPTELRYDIPAAADRADLVVTDATGQEVARQPIDPDGDGSVWPGPGVTFPDGTYGLYVTPHAGDQELAPVAVSHYSRVSEVSLTGGQTQLVLADGQTIPSASIAALREPAAPS
ncbi:MAG: flagellar hook capping FlgD N-terminal domain-containing protein [Pseudomonadota bacterium]